MQHQTLPQAVGADNAVLTDLEASAIASALEAVADVQLKIDSDGVVVDVSITNPELPDLRHAPWQGQAWLDTVSEEHRDRAAEALNRARAKPGVTTRADLDHPLPGVDTNTPISYRLICGSAGGPVYAIGIDLRAVSSLRQQLVNAQQAMEQDYWSTRQIENRYRKLFEMANDAFIVVDEMSGRVLEANPRAAQMLSGDGQRLVGKVFPVGVATASVMAVEAAIAEARATGNSEITSKLAHVESSALMSISYLRQGTESRFLIRVTTKKEIPGTVDDNWGELADNAADAILLVNDSGIVQYTNRSFLDWTQIANAESVIGRPADEWIGRSSVDMTVLLSNLRQHHHIRLYASTLRSVFGTRADVEISAARVSRGDGDQYALFIREVSHRVTAEHPMTEQLPRSIEQITRRVGRVPLKELVRESTDVIEALCIEAALQLTKDNRASAAELLGLSRQSLYTKLRRYGIGESD
jgi:transcriptional regulator PpsR